MKRRVRYDEMKPIDEPIWLVVRDKYQTPRHVVQHPPGTDPIPVMVAAMSKSVRLGFTIEQMPGNFATYFCTKGDERNKVGIERTDPHQRIDPKLEPPNNVTTLKR